MSESAVAEIETLSVTYSRGNPSAAVVIAKTDKGRIVARARRGDFATMIALDNPSAIGSSVSIVHEDGGNFVDSVAGG